MATVPAANAQVATGPELPEIATSSLGFKSLAGDFKLQLPIKWSLNSLPPTSSSLLAVSSAKGLLAAAGEEGLFLGSTDNIRAALKNGQTKDGVAQITPDFALPLPRLSHVCFTADGACLVVAAEQGGGLAVYSTLGLAKKDGKPAFELPTEGISIRSLVANPETPHLLAVVLANGHLMIANLEEKSFARGLNGVASLKDGVTCVAWSVRGRQLVAGLQNGNAVQIDTTGAIKALIPRAPNSPSNQTISSILWLKNDEFLLIYSTPSPGADSTPESIFYYLRTDKERTKFEFRQGIDPSFPIHTRSPVAHFTSRIRKWSKLDDVIFTASTASADIGLVTNSQSALTSHADANEIVNTYIITSMEEDSRRATLPMSLDPDDSQDTFPIGMALDLSSRDKVYQPIPGDDTITGDSPHPLPELFVLNHEGILTSWFFVNDAAIRNGEACPGLVAIEGPGIKATPKSPTSAAVASPQTASPFASAKLNLGNGFSKPAQSAFGQSGFGQSPATTAFGSNSALGSSQSPWSNGGAKPATQAFGKPSFGAPSAMGGTAFGQTNSMGQSKSLWGAPAAPAMSTAAVSSPPASPFGSMAGGASGFAKLGASTKASPFGAISQQGASPFAQATSSFGNSTPIQSFGSTVSIDSNTAGSTLGGKSVFGSNSLIGTSSYGQSTFGQKAPTQQPDNASNSGFKLGSTFIPASSAKELDMEDVPSKLSEPSLNMGSLGTDLSLPAVKQEEDDQPQNFLNLSPLRDLRPPPSQSSSDFKQDVDTPLSDVKKSIEDEPPQEPEPPQITSKPIPSPLTTAPSSAAHSLGSLPALDQAQEQATPAPTQKEADEPLQVSSPPRSTHSSDDADADAEDDFENDENEGPEISEPPSAASTPPRNNLETPDLTAQSILGSSAPQWKGKYNNLPLVSSPLAQKPVAGPSHKASAYTDSPSGVPPAVPTPPAAGAGRGVYLGGLSSTTPHGLPRPAWNFPPPQELNESPRSPSPVRQPLSGPRLPAMPLVIKQAQKDENTTQHSITSPEPVETEVLITSLRDKQHDYVQKELAKPISPTLDIPPLISSVRYRAELPPAVTEAIAAEPEFEGLPGNVERVFRDVNCMIDTLGLNARALASFVQGNEISREARDGAMRVKALSKSLDMDEDDEEEVDDVDWKLDDMQRFPEFERRLNVRLTGERLHALLQHMAELGTVRGGSRVLRADVKRMRTFLASKRATLGGDSSSSSPFKPGRAPAPPLPLDPAWSTLQRELRVNLAEFRRLLAEAEEALSVARAKLATRGQKRGPTVEAVESTVRRMTGMVEKRSGDLDVLELQMRKLGLVGSGGHARKGSSASAWKRASVGPGGVSQLSASTASVGRTFGFDGADDEDDDDDDEHGVVSLEELERRERVRRCVEVRARRKVVLDKLREYEYRAQTRV